MTPGPLVTAHGLWKVYGAVAPRVEALRDVDLVVERGECVGIMGPSGCGKSSLLHILGCLDRPTSGTYVFAGRDVARLSDAALSRLRARNIGFVFQNFNLIPQYDVLDNVALPFLYWEEPVPDAAERAAHALDHVGLSHRRHHRPVELSGGEMQRVAIARALVVEPQLILADEPTGNLDSATSARILDTFSAVHEHGTTLVMVTHDAQVAERCGRVVQLQDGRVAAEAACA